MSSLLTQVAQAAKNIQEEGKEPSLALIKSRLGAVTMSPALLQAYQAWRQGAGTTDTDAPSTAQIKPDSQLFPTELHTQLDRIEQKLDRLLLALAKESA